MQLFTGRRATAIAEFLDRVDRKLCQAGLLRQITWDVVRSGRCKQLYAGGLYRHLPQFKTHVGISPFECLSRNIKHDLRNRMPIDDNSVTVFQAEDVFEHISYPELGAVIEDIYRVLEPGGLFRLSVPDYRCDILRDRSEKDRDGVLIFDPEGGGSFVNDIVTGGGHLWFPTYETIKALMDQSSFAAHGEIHFMHYTMENGSSVMKAIDYSMGYVQRTPDNDIRVMTPHRVLSIVVDAIKHNDLR